MPSNNHSKAKAELSGLGKAPIIGGLNLESLSITILPNNKNISTL